MRPPDGRSDGLDEVLRAIADDGFRSAAREINERLCGEDADDLRARFRKLLLAIREESGLPNAGDLTAPELASFYRLIDLLRSATLQRWSESPPANVTGVLALLQAIERVRRSLHPGAEREDITNAIAVVRAPEVLLELAHDIRSPLTSILFLAETLQRGQSGPLTETQRTQLGIIYSAALSLLSMASDVTELARSGDQPAEKYPSPCEIGEILSSVTDLVSPVVDHAKLVLRTSPPTNGYRIGYPIALRRVLLNLVTNALKNTERGLVEVIVREVAADRLEFSVRDTGQGIDPETQATLFEPFRTRPTNGRIGLSGTGLGLWTSRRLVAEMGGKLQFETRPGRGTRFFFEVEMGLATAV